MTPRTFFLDPLLSLVADSSMVINLIATGQAPAIIRAIRNPIVVVDIIPDELETGRKRGRRHADQLQELVDARGIALVSLGDAGWVHFESLVAGPASQTLDDGEAATIAYAVENEAIAIIDERRGTRIGAAKFPKLRIASTVDVLLHPPVRETLGEEAFADAVFAALRDARMAVFPRNLEQVVLLVGTERAATCQSLPKAFRFPARRPG